MKILLMLIVTLQDAKYGVNIKGKKGHIVGKQYHFAKLSLP
jgi:hypothetical protein